MKAIKITFAIILVVTLLVVGGVVAVLLNLGTLVENAVVTHGPEVTSTPVNLEGVNISLFKGVAELNGFEVANPAEFTSPNAFKANVLRVRVDPKSLRSGTIVLEDITIDGMQIIAEQKGLKTNIQVLHEAVKRFARNNVGNAKANDEVTSGAVPEPRFILNNLVFINNSMTLITESYGDYTLDVPALTRSNLDGGGKGLTVAELGLAIFEPILEVAEESAKRKLKKVAKSQVEDKLKSRLESKLTPDSEEKIDKLKGLLGR
jgi:hypothetical protein